MEVRRWITVTILLTVLAVALQVAGFVAPMWIWLEEDSFKVGVGLWFTTGCGQQDTCESAAPNVSFSYKSDDIWTDPQFTAVRVLETLAMAGGILLLLFLVVYRLGYGSWTNMDELNLASFVTCIVIWLCILAGLIVYCAYYWPVVGTSPLVNVMSFPWCLVLCLLAAAVFIVVTVLIRSKCRDRAYLKDALPVAGDTNMEQYPVTKHGLLHRYFSPLYRGMRGNNPAIGYQGEGKSMHTLNTRLVDAEEHNQVAAIDNVAFYAADHRVAGGANDTNANYRYLPGGGQHYNGVQSTETVIRRSLPTAIVTYMGGNTSDAQRLYTHQGGGTATAVTPHNDLNRDLNRDARRADFHLHHTSDGATHNVTHRDAAAAAATAGRSGEHSTAYLHHAGGVRTDVMSHQTRGVDEAFSTREDGGAVYGREGHSREDRSAVYRGEGHSRENGAVYRGGGHSREDGGALYREGHSRDAADVGGRTRHHSGDGMVTPRGDHANDAPQGRGTPNIIVRDASGNIITEERVVTTTYVTEEGHERRGGLKVTDVESSDGREGHTSRGYFSSTLSARSDGDSVHPYDDTYIYRPYSETV